ncbi:pyridoxamine 5'-phosphate oxidase family protein, partial [bacterium]|nr:pyridoxamine 5'-phosphate oxidase family protein [bacterium]
MDLRDYFENAKGKGVMSTADASGVLTAAVYARPHVMDDGTVAFIMADRLTHKNLESNPHAVYLFLEEGDKYKG